MYSIISCAKDYLNVIKRGTDNISETFSHTEKAKQIKAQTKTKEINELKERESGKLSLSMVNTLFVLVTLM